MFRSGVVSTVHVSVKGNNDKTTKFLKKARTADPISILQKYGEMGIGLLTEATPKNTGLTSESWYYEVIKEAGVYRLNFNNSNIQNGIRIAIILDVGHGTGNGGYVQGRNYIEPTIRPVFEKIANEAWREITDAK